MPRCKEKQQGLQVCRPCCSAVLNWVQKIDRAHSLQSSVSLYRTQKKASDLCIQTTIFCFLVKIGQILSTSKLTEHTVSSILFYLPGTEYRCMMDISSCCEMTVCEGSAQAQAIWMAWCGLLGLVKCMPTFGSKPLVASKPQVIVIKSCVGLFFMKQNQRFWFWPVEQFGIQKINTFL